MRKLLLLIPVFFASFCHAAEKWTNILNDEVQTSRGPLIVERTSSFSFEIRLDGKTIEGFDKDSSSASLSDVIHVGNHELVVVAQDSGGIACPITFVVLEISASPRLSNEFGNCNPALRLTPERDSLQIAMPSYFAHPELLSPAERRQLRSKVDRYVWSNGKVEPRK